MRRLVSLIFLFLGLHSLAAQRADSFSIEDKNLSKVPRAVEMAIRKGSDTEFEACALVGKSLDLAGQGDISVFAATTAQACGWGAAQGPIWVVHVADGKSKLVLSALGYSLTVGKQLQKGLPHLATSSGTAAYYSEALWKFDGVRYQRAKSYYFAADDEATCKAHPKICPFAFER